MPAIRLICSERPPSRTRTGSAANAICALAGIAGEGMDTGGDIINLLIDSGAVDGDIEIARRALATIGKGSTDDLVALFPFALDIVERHARLIDRIAPVLALVHRLTYDHCLSLCAGHVEPRGGAERPCSGGFADLVPSEGSIK
jgi:hypothetical protein